MEEIKNLLWNNQYTEAVQLAKRKLDENPHNPRYWYALFLAENKNFSEVCDTPSNEMSLTKALSEADGKFKKRLQNEYFILRKICIVPNLGLLFLAIADSNQLEANQLLKNAINDTTQYPVDIDFSFYTATVEILESGSLEEQMLYRMFFYIVSIRCQNFSIS